MGSDAQECILRFQYSGVGARELQEAVDAILADPGADAPSLGDLDVSVSIHEEGQGLEPILTTIVISIVVKAGSKAASDVWQDVLWPRLKKRIGVDAVGPKKD